MKMVIFTLFMIVLILASMLCGEALNEDSYWSVLGSGFAVFISLAICLSCVNFDKPNPYTPAIVLAHNGSTTIFQEVDSDKIHIIDKYYEDNNQYLLDIVDDEIVVVWSVDEGSLG